MTRLYDDELRSAGLRTTQYSLLRYLKQIVMHPEFVKGDYDTGFLGRFLAGSGAAASGTPVAQAFSEGIR